MKLSRKIVSLALVVMMVDIPFEKCTLFGISVHPYPA